MMLLLAGARLFESPADARLAGCRRGAVDHPFAFAQEVSRSAMGGHAVPVGRAAQEFASHPHRTMDLAGDPHTADYFAGAGRGRAVSGKRRRQARLRRSDAQGAGAGRLILDGLQAERPQPFRSGQGTGGQDRRRIEPRRRLYAGADVVTTARRRRHTGIRATPIPPGDRQSAAAARRRRPAGRVG